jgi:hypothetical protein
VYSAVAPLSVATWTRGSDPTRLKIFHASRDSASAPSWGSVAEPVTVILDAERNCESLAAPIVATGAALPGVIAFVVVAVAPCGSVIVSRAV